MLTDHQKEAWQVIKKGFKNDELSLLAGSAGTGKTFMLNYIIDYIRSKNKTCHICTPTHKSAKVVRDFVGTKVPVGTIHSYLRIKEIITSKGRKFVPDRYAPPPMNLDFLIIDESSMLSMDLIKYIGEYQQYYKHILFVGDSAQLPPVDDSYSMSGTIPPIFNLDIDYQVELTEIVRQAQDNPIIKDATMIRDCIFERNYRPMKELISNCNLIYDYEDFSRLYIEKMLNKEDIILGSFTNKNVDHFNSLFRAIDYIDYDGDLPAVIEGETIIANEAYVVDKVVVIPNNSEIYIDSLEADIDSNNFRCYRIRGVCNGRLISLKIIHENDEKLLKEKISQYRKKALAYGRMKDKKKAKEEWGKMYKLKDEYLAYKHKYSCTLHKLQGSTYNEVFLDFRDLPVYNKDLMYRLMYVGLTRTRNSVNILL